MPDNAYPTRTNEPSDHRASQPEVTYRDFWTCSSCGAQESLSTEDMTWSATSPQAIADRLLLRLGGLEREELWVLSLSTKNRVLDERCIYRGSLNQALVRVSELFTEAVRRNAASILMVHGHPSGDATPSPDDLHLTAEVLAAGKLLDINLLDHIILGGSTSYVSLRDRGIQFSR